MQSSRECRYCGKQTAGKESLTKHLNKEHAMEELSRVDRKRVDEYTRQNSRWQTVSEGSPVSRRGALAALAGGVPVVGGLAAAAGSSLPPSGSTDGSVADRSPPKTDSHDDVSVGYYRNPVNWNSSGPDTHFVTDTTVYDAGVDLKYDSDDFSATYEFSVTAQETAEIGFDWNWRFCHSFNDSDAKAYKFADTPSGRSEQLLRDTGGCVETRTGTVNLNIYQGMDWGIKIEGSHFDSRHEISGRFAIDLPEISMIRIEGNNATFSNTTIESG